MNTSSAPIFKIRKVIHQRKWSKEEDALLLKLAEKYNARNWKKIASYFQNKVALQCFSRYKRIRPGLNRGPWTKEEDKFIIKYIHIYGTDWSTISKKMGTRNGKQIRDRYINVLDPLTNKKRFTEEEDQLLINLFKQFGAKWSTIAKFMNKRTPDMIKNRFHSYIKKVLGLNEVKPTNRKLSTDQNQNDISEESISNKPSSLFSEEIKNESEPEQQKDCFNFQDYLENEYNKFLPGNDNCVFDHSPKEDSIFGIESENDKCFFNEEEKDSKSFEFFGSNKFNFSEDYKENEENPEENSFLDKIYNFNQFSYSPFKFEL